MFVGAFYPSLLSFICDDLLCKCTPLIKWNQVWKTYFPYCLQSFAHVPQTFHTLSRHFPTIPMRQPNLLWCLSDPHPTHPSSFLHIFLLPWIMGPTQSLLLSERHKMVYLPKTLPPPPVFSVLIGHRGEESMRPSRTREGAYCAWLMAQQGWVREAEVGVGAANTQRREGLIEPSQAQPWRCYFGVFPK